MDQQEKRLLRKERKEEKKRKIRREKAIKKTTKIVSILVIIGIIIVGVIWFFSSQPYLPPTTMRDHIEVSPPSHIVTVPIPENIQKHMLEHADGGGDPGIVIQYNCDKFECENDLISKLTQIAEEFPDNVYLAPNKYDALIVLTKLGRRKVLDDFDGDEIRKFINPNYVPGEPQEPATETISMEAGLFFFTPETLEAKVGEEVILNISATGGHTFTIDELDVNVSLPHGETTRVLFTPEVTGTFEYYCSIPGHRESGQMGMLEVL